MLKAFNNDKENLSIIYQELVPGLYRYGSRFTHHPELVMDSIHDVFLKLCEKEDISAVSNMKFYLMRSLRNNLLDKLAQKPVENLCETTYNYLYERSIEDQLIEDEEAQQIKTCLERTLDCLTPREREKSSIYVIWSNKNTMKYVNYWESVIKQHKSQSARRLRKSGKE